MTFGQLYKTLLKRWSIIVVCFLVVGVGAYVGSAVLMKPHYESTAVVQVIVRVGGSPLTEDNGLASQNLAETEASLVTTSPVLTPVIVNYPGLSEEDLASEVTATVTSGTPLLAINVMDTSPSRAASLANDIAASLIKQQTLQLQPAPTDGQFLVVADAAHPASAPSRPNKLLNTGAGLVIGLLLGMLLAILVEWFDPRVRSSDAVTSLVNWPLLGIIGQAEPGKAVSIPAGYNPNTDAYSTLRTNVGFASKARSAHIFVVTSGMPGEGKSVVAANLAMSMARAGKKTLLIDANLRHPTLHEIFAIPPQAKGFSNALLALKMLGNSTAQQVLARTAHTELPKGLSLTPFVQTVNVPNLAVMPSGPLPPGPAELLGSDVMQHFFTVLRQHGTEVVIFDTASLLGLPDAALLSSKADATLVVLDMAGAKKEPLKEMKTLLAQAGALVLGYVVNKQHLDSKQSPYGNIVHMQDQNAGQWAQRERESREDRDQLMGNAARVDVRVDVEKQETRKELSVNRTSTPAPDGRVEDRNQPMLNQKKER
ncbi:MAG TPA: Wzz/FepE/Etk N-terminal domain-containing protein [Ktedonobacteraceae bacterium]|jgi:Mrp family chromosome partitioning ATPase|nr:Wzz/FepE/Etk N-terminal domain-containing protein [Ktedonobacteraceae bacterium]